MRKVMLVAYVALAYLRLGSAGAGEKNQPVALSPAMDPAAQQPPAVPPSRAFTFTKVDFELIKAALEPNGYILGANREASLGQKLQNSLESVTSVV
jgi:hypothetical protein